MAKRVNTRFLLILTIIVVGGGIALLLAAKILSHKDPQKYINIGDEAMAQKQWDAATKAYLQARGISSKDPAIWLKLGDAYEKLGIADPTYLGKQFEAWNQAITLDPDYLPALQRLLEAMRQQSEFDHSVSLYRQISDTADKILAINQAQNAPPDPMATAAKHLATVQMWLGGVDVDGRTIDQDESALTELIKKDPSNAELPYYAAQVKIRRGQSAVRNGQSQTKAQALFDQAVALFTGALKGQPKNAGLHYEFSRVLNDLGYHTPGIDRKQAQAWRDQSQHEIEQAQALATSKDADYVAINLEMAGRLATAGKPAEGDQLLQKLEKDRPGDPSIRMQRAEILGRDPQTRSQAIALLQQAFNPPVTMRDAVLLRALEPRAALKLAEMHLDEYEGEQDAAKQKALLEEAQKAYDKATGMIAESPESLKVKGRILLAQNKDIEAIQALDRADQLFKQSGREDFGLKYLLAKSYMATGQTRTAKGILTDLLKRFPTIIPAHLQLAEILAKNPRTAAEAAEHVDFLEKAAPNDPRVITLRIAVLAAEGKKDQIKPYYDRLPEKTRADQVNKAKVALSLGQRPEAQRLLEAVVSASPADMEAVRALAEIYQAEGQKPKALALVDAAMKADPGNATLKLLNEQLEGASSEKLVSGLREQYAHIADPFTREAALGDLESHLGHSKEAMAHWKKAEGLKPDNIPVLEAIFKASLAKHDWDEATRYSDKLSSLRKDDPASAKLYPFELAMAKGTKADLEAAVVIARKLVADYPQFARSYLSLGRALEKSGQYDEARAQYQQALQRQGDNLTAYRGLIVCSFALGQPEQGKGYIEKARKSFPTNSWLAEQQIEYWLRYGDPTKAIAPREAQFKQNPDNADVAQALGQSYLRAMEYRDAHNDAAGAKQFEAKARDLYARAVNKWPAESRFYGHLADLAMADNNPAEAERILMDMTARKAWHDKPEPWLMLGEFYARTGKPDQAEKALRDALAKSGNDVSVEQRLANYLPRMGKADDALKLLETMHADDLRIQLQKIDLLLSMGRLKDAEKSILDREKAEPRSPRWKNMLAYVYLKTDRLAEASAKIDESLALDGQNARALDLRARLRLHSGKYFDVDAATRDLLALRKMDPSNLDYRMTLAQAYLADRNTDAAITQLEAVLRAVPNNKSARLELAKVYASSHPPRWNDLDRLFREAGSIESLKNDPDLQLLEARSLMARHENAKALAKITELHKQWPASDTVTMQWLEILLKNGKYNEVLNQAQKLVAAAKGNPSPNLYEFAAIAKKGLNDIPGAMEYFKLALDTPAARKSDRVRQNIVTNIARQIGVKQALPIALEQAQSDPNWQMTAASLYLVGKDYVNAAKMAEKLLQQVDKLDDAQKVMAWRLAGDCYMGIRPQTAQSIGKSRGAYLKVLDLSPDDVAALNNLAYLLAQNSISPSPEEARVYSQRAYETMRKKHVFQASIADTQGWVLTLCAVGPDDPKLIEGLNILRDMIDRDPFPEGRYHLAEALLKGNRPREAQEQLQKAIGELNNAHAAVNPELKGKIDAALKKSADLMKAKREAKAE